VELNGGERTVLDRCNKRRANRREGHSRGGERTEDIECPFFRCGGLGEVEVFSLDLCKQGGTFGNVNRR